MNRPSECRRTRTHTHTQWSAEHFSPTSDNANHSHFGGSYTVVDDKTHKNQQRATLPIQSRWNAGRIAPANRDIIEASAAWHRGQWCEPAPAEVGPVIRCSAARGRKHAVAVKRHAGRCGVCSTNTRRLDSATCNDHVTRRTRQSAPYPECHKTASSCHRKHLHTADDRKSHGWLTCARVRVRTGLLIGRYA